MVEEKGAPAPKQEKEPRQRKPWTRKEFGGKPVWDWMQLLIVPLVLAVIGLLFEMQQAERQRALEEQQQALEEQRAQAERELAEQRAQDEALQAYLDQMSGLLLEKDLRDSEKGSEARTLARARTVTVIQRLNSDRNGHVIRFLDEAGLIGKEESSIRLLAGANLRGAHLQGIDLYGTDLSKADLSKADLSGAILSEALLSKALLSKANLSEAYLANANLNWADLSRADLSRADQDGLGAILDGATLNYANLDEADLTGAVLNRADLRNAYLLKADLSDASVTNEQLGQALTLAGATMPNGATVPTGQKYEDWLKSKGRGEDGKNSGP